VPAAKGITNKLVNGFHRVALNGHNQADFGLILEQTVFAHRLLLGLNFSHPPTAA
jgi:hypothetical protein